MQAAHKQIHVEGLRGMIAAISSITAVGLSISLASPLLSFEIERRGISSTLNGLNGAIYGVAALIMTPLISRLALRIGFIRLMLVASIVSALSLLCIYFTPEFWMWFPLRFLGGASVSVLFVLSEFWINALAPEKSRGVVLGIYATVLSIGLAAGPIIILVTGVDGLLPYVVGSLLMMMAMVPVLWAGNQAPQMGGGSTNSFFSFLFLAPVATGAAFVIGALESSSFSLLPIYGLRIGYAQNIAVVLITLVMLGNVAFQIPFGILSDKMDRRKLLFVCGLLGLLGCVSFPFVAGTQYLFYTVLFAWGGATGALYTVGLAHLGSRFSGLDLVNANSAFIFCYALGMLIGPALTGVSMDLLSTIGFPVALAFFALLYTLLCFFRMMRPPSA